MGFATKIGVFPKIASASKFAFVRITVITAFAEHEVVGQLHVQVLAGELELLCNLVVAGAGVGVARGVVVAKHDGGSQLAQGMFQHDFRIDRGFRHPTMTDAHGVDDAVLVVHQQHPTFLVVQVGHFGMEQFVDVPAVPYLHPLHHFRGTPSFTDLQRRRNGDRLDRPDS